MKVPTSGGRLFGFYKAQTGQYRERNRRGYSGTPGNSGLQVRRPNIFLHALIKSGVRLVIYRCIGFVEFQHSHPPSPHPLASLFNEFISLICSFNLSFISNTHLLIFVQQAVYLNLSETNIVVTDQETSKVWLLDPRLK